MNKIVVYTAIYGNYDKLIDDQFVMDGVDYICFTDNPNLKSNLWAIHYHPPIFMDQTRSAKVFKILPHTYFPEYDYSIWIDGNVKIKKDLRELISKGRYLVFDHNQNILDPRDCIYDEYEAILDLGRRHGKFKDEPSVMVEQMLRYREAKYPAHNGLTQNSVLFRKHNDLDIINLMGAWWVEIQNGSKRDQLSFNYVAWKHNFKYILLDGDSRNNEYFFNTGVH